MYAIKGGWVGQTFALAKCSSDSGGKKSRIRRSKEERKALVESFIKKHQKINNGSFPSLNLTHKEVGGSFYTVREIVREVIQENKILGPGIITPEQHNFDDILEQYPTNTIFSEPEFELLTENGFDTVTHILPHHQDTFEESVPSANDHNLGYIYLNGSSEVVHDNEEQEDRENLVLEESVEDKKASSAKVINLETALRVETSLLTSGSGESYGLGDEFGVLNGNSVEKRGESSVGDTINFLENASDIRNNPCDESLEGEIEFPLEENSNNSTVKESTDILPNDHQCGSEESVLNADIQGLEEEYRTFGQELQTNGLGKAFEKTEEYDKDIYVYSGEITRDEKSSNGSVLNEYSGEKGGESSDGDTINFLENASDLRNKPNDESLVDKLEFPVEENPDNSTAKESTDILPNHHEGGSKESVLNADIQDLELENQTFVKELQIIGSGNAFEKTEESDKNIYVFSGDREILLDEKASNESVLDGNSGEKGGESFVGDTMSFLENASDLKNKSIDASLVDKLEFPVEENPDNSTAKESTDILLNHHQRGSEESVLNADIQDLELENQTFVKELRISGSGKAFEKTEESDKDVYVFSGDREISLDEKSSNGNVLNEKSGEKEGGNSIGDMVNLLENASHMINKPSNESLEGKMEFPVEENSDNSTIKESTDILLNHHQGGSVESDLNADIQRFGEELQINGSDKAFEKTVEYDQDISVFSGDKEISLDEKSSNGSVLNENLEKAEVESSVGDVMNFQENASDLTDAQKIAIVAVQELENCSDMLIQKPGIIVEGPLKEISEVSKVKEDAVLETEEKESSIVGIKITNPKNSINIQSPNANKISSKQKIPKMPTAMESKPNIHLGDDLKEANPTLDRMNLESWKTTSDKNQKMINNPILVLFKAFVTAFVKFWSE